MLQRLFFLLLVAAAAAQNPQADQYFELNGDYAASHILIPYKTAPEAKAEVTRNKRQARDLAARLISKLQADPSLFAELAKEHSEGPSAAKGGYLGGFRKKSMERAFESAVRKLEDGELAASPIKTVYGYHIIRREPLKVKHYSARALVIGYKDADRILGVTPSSRSQEEAKALADSLAAQVNAENFRQLVTENGDLKTRGGLVGVFPARESDFTDSLIPHLEKLDYGQVSPLIETKIGYLVLQRVKVVEIGASRLIISYRGTEHVFPNVTRSRKDARQLAGELAAQLQKDPKRWKELVNLHSDGPFKIREGRVPNWLAGTQDEKTEEAILAVGIGEITPDPVENDFGYVIFKRENPEKSIF